MNQETKYLMSFTTGGLFYSESILLLDFYTDNWDNVIAQALEKNILQTRVVSTAKKILREVIGRLSQLTSEELVLLRRGSVTEQKYLLWIAICRRHQFIYEFATEVIRERYLTLKHDLPKEEFEVFYNMKEEWHEELEKIADSTRKKLRAVLYRMLKEAEIIDANNIILPAMLSNELIATVAKHDVNDLLVFPVSDIDLQKVVS